MRFLKSLILAYVLLSASCWSVRTLPPPKYIHVSEFNPPLRFDDFKFWEKKTYDQQGINFSVSYYDKYHLFWGTTRSIIVTVYIYPIFIKYPSDEETMNIHFDEYIEVIMNQNMGSEILYKGKCYLGETNGRKSIFTFPGDANLKQSEFYLFMLKGIFLKYRITFPEYRKDEVKSKIRDFVNDFNVYFIGYKNSLK